MLNKIRNKGFSFIEVLTVVSLIGVMTSIGIASYNSFSERKEVEVEAANFKKNLRSIQSKSLSGEKNCDICDGPDNICSNADDLGLEGWNVEYLDSGSYQTYGICGGNSFSAKTYNLDEDVTITQDFGTIQFETLGGTSLGTGTTVFFKNSRNYSVGVSIDAVGKIQ